MSVYYYLTGNGAASLLCKLFLLIDLRLKGTISTNLSLTTVNRLGDWCLHFIQQAVTLKPVVLKPRCTTRESWEQ